MQTEIDQFFADIQPLVTPTSTVQRQTEPNPSEIADFFHAVGHRVDVSEELQRRANKQTAAAFNLLHLIDPDENKLSDILAGLLDPKGAHGQGELFLRLFSKQLNFELPSIELRNARVQREVPTHGISKFRRRIDVLVTTQSFLLAIENKVDSLEQPDQVKNYLEHLDYCCREGIHGALIYLTPDGRLPAHPACDNLHCWSYQREIRTWLEACQKECAAPKLRYFLSDFAAYVETTLNRESVVAAEEEEDEE